MKTYTPLFGLILLAGLLAASPVLAQGAAPDKPATQEHKGDHKDRAAMMEKTLQELGLTPEQKEKMAALRSGGEGKQKAAFQSIKAKKDELKALLDGPNPDEAKAKALAGEISALESTMMQARIDHIIKLRQILTPEQFKKLEEIRQKHRAERKGEWKNGGHGEAGPEGE
ncbi:MAG: Spy/CpxP family protein refolding chaperone [Candidatus Omnitrophota bacterium]